MINLLNKLKNFFFSFGRFASKAKTVFHNGRLQTELDKKLVFSLAKSRWPSLSQLKYLKKYLSRGERLLIGSCLTVILLSFSFIAIRFYQNHLETMPIAGGEYTEGVIGSIKYLNPLYSTVSDLDSDITGLVYSSLFKRGRDAQLENDLVESYEMSQDGKIYDLKILSGVLWHNGNYLTADDVVFTFNAIKNQRYKSPLRAGLTGVEIEKIDDLAVRFKLKEPYAAFLELLTFGILPQELWQQIEPEAAGLAELNIKPVGSGRYKYKSLVKDKSGNIRTYSLGRNAAYYRQPAYIETINFKLYGAITELIDALNNGFISGINYLPEQAKSEVVAQDSLNFYHLNLTKLAIVFFNTKSAPALADKKVRQALAYAIDKNKIIREAVGGNAREINSPVLPESFAYNSNLKKYFLDTATSSRLLAEAGWKPVELKEEDISRAQEDLSSGDEVVKKQAEAKIKMGVGRWLIKDNNYLTIELTAPDNQEYGLVAELIAGFWLQINVKTSIKTVPISQIQTEVIKPRNYAALIFSEYVGVDPDLYAFWHSSQTGQAGINLAEYANPEIDKLLEEGRLTVDQKVRQEKYLKFQEILTEDEPAIFLYNPYYTYVQSKNIKGFKVQSIVSPSDRFTDASQWYMKTGRKIVW